MARHAWIAFVARVKGMFVFVNYVFRAAVL
jgi:hypothetical protein